MMRDLQEIIFQIAVKEKQRIWQFFLLVYITILTMLAWGSVIIVSDLPGLSFVYSIGVWSGRAAAGMLALVLIPGILGRFGIQIKVTRVLTFYRRQLGITTFFLSLTHGMLVRIVARFALGQYPLSRAPIFELFGTVALSFLFFLFITSNDWSVGRLGPWWKLLHRLVYIIVWLIFFHTILQRVSVWSMAIGVVAILEVVSLLWSGRLGRGRGIGTG
ncbi:MAG: ferric reductase-like transmembrane domain-containing protein [Patescibacteria group bacterium]